LILVLQNIQQTDLFCVTSQLQHFFKEDAFLTYNDPITSAFTVWHGKANIMDFFAGLLSAITWSNQVKSAPFVCQHNRTHFWAVTQGALLYDTNAYNVVGDEVLRNVVDWTWHFMLFEKNEHQDFKIKLLAYTGGIWQWIDSDTGPNNRTSHWRKPYLFFPGNCSIDPLYPIQ